MIEQIQILMNQINEITTYRYGVNLLKHIDNNTIKYINELANISKNELKNPIPNEFIYEQLINDELIYVDELSDNNYTPVYVNQIIELFEDFSNEIESKNIPNAIKVCLEDTLKYLNNQKHTQQLELTDFTFLTNDQQIKNKLLLEYGINFNNELEVKIQDVSFLDNEEEEIEILNNIVKIKKFDGVVFKTPQTFYTNACGENDKCKWYLVNSLLVSLLNKCIGNEGITINQDDECYYHVLIQLKENNED